MFMVEVCPIREELAWAGGQLRAILIPEGALILLIGWNLFHL